MKLPVLTSVALLASLACACSDAKPPASAPGAPAVAAPGPAAAPASTDDAASAGAGTMQGKVVEILNTSGYTYVRVQPAGGAETWAATTEFPVKAGDEVIFSTGMAMRDYESQTLKRKFDVVYFSDAIQVVGASRAPSLREQVPPATAHGSPGSTVPAGVDLAGIEKAPGGMTVAEILAQAATLDGKEVAVRGRVVKATFGVLGKNWLHLRDGSGADGAADLTVTTEGEATIGDLVIARGRVATNQDFGSGYSYPVLMQDAKLEK